MLKRERYKILVADDDVIVRLSAEKILDTLGYESVLVESAEQGKKYLEEHHEEIALVLSDLCMEQEDSGIELLVYAKCLDEDLPFCLFSGVADTELYISKANSLGSSSFLAKPLSEIALQRVLDEALITPEYFQSLLKYKKKPLVCSAGDFLFNPLSANGDYSDFNLLFDKLEYFAQLQKKGTPIIVGVGNNSAMETIDSLTRNQGDAYPALKRNHDAFMKGELKNNANYICSLLNNDGSIAVEVNLAKLPSQSYRVFKEEYLKSNKIMVASSVPRHMRINRPDVISQKYRDFPIVPVADSNARIKLLLELFGAQDAW